MNTNKPKLRGPSEGAASSKSKPFITFHPGPIASSWGSVQVCRSALDQPELTTNQENL